MKLLNKLFLSLILLGVFSGLAHAQSPTWYDDPIKLNARYASDPQKIILESIEPLGWKVKAQQPGKLTIWLDNYDNHEIVMDIGYNASEITFQHISSRKLKCHGKNCKADSDDYDRWRLYLRKAIARKIHELALIQMLNGDEIKGKLIAALKQGTVREKRKVAEDMVRWNFFDAELLDIIETNLKNVFELKDLSKDEIQKFAWYSKALARSQNEKYGPLLVEVRNSTSNKRLRRYLAGYIKNNFPALAEE